MQVTSLTSERRVYKLEGVGTLRLSRWNSRAATTEAHGLSWQLSANGMWHPMVRAIDAAGSVAGEFRHRPLIRGGALRWCGRELTLRPVVHWLERYALVEDGHTLATIECRGWGKRPPRVHIHDAVAIEPGLLLFAVFVVGTLAQNALTEAMATA